MVSRDDQSDFREEFDQWNLDPELRYHIQHCPCPCNHLGYGSFLNYQTSPFLYDFQISPPSPPPFYSIPNYPPADFYYDYTSTDSCSTKSDRSLPLHPHPTCYGAWYICLIISVIVLTITIGLYFPSALSPPLHLQSFNERLKVVHRILKTAPLIDGHNDLPWNLRKFTHNQLRHLNFTALSATEPWASSRWSHTDLERLRQGLLGAQLWSAYVPCAHTHRNAVQTALEQIDTVRRLIAANGEALAFVDSSGGLVRAHQAGQIASLIGVEGGHTIGNSLAVLRTFYNLGARYLTLTHSCDTSWALGSNSQRPDTGLSEFGRSVIREMNRLGMIVDLSHTSINTAKTAINSSHAPVIFSHSSAYSLCNSSRNVPDEVLELIKQNGGVVMVNFYTYLLTCSDNATIRDVIRHINHIRRIAGVDHVGIGAGYDGINATPMGLENVSRYPNLLSELLADAVWSEEDLALLAGRNFLRVFAKVEEVRDEWKRAEVLPGESSDVVEAGLDCKSIYA